MADADDTKSAARKKARKVTLIGHIVVTMVFVGICAWQIIPAALGMGATPVAAGDGPLKETARACVDGAQRLAAAVDRAASESARAEDEGLAVAAFRSALAPEWNDAAAVEARCAESPRGADAYAALLRLRLAEEAIARRRAVEVAPLKRNVAAYLPH